LFSSVRLRVDYSGYSTCNPQRFGQRFVDRVANPSDILLFTRKAKKRAAGDSRNRVSHLDVLRRNSPQNSREEYK